MLSFLFFASLVVYGSARPPDEQHPKAEQEVLTADELKPLVVDTAETPHGQGNDTEWKPWFGPRPEQLPNKDWILVSYADGTPIPGLAEYRAKHNQALIVNGKNAVDGEQTYMASLQTLYNSRLYHICGGSLWTTTKVVTAQQCVNSSDGSDPIHRVALGYYQLSLGSRNPGAQIIPVASIANKPGYTYGRSRPSDISVITLAFPANLTAAVGTITIISNPPTQFVGTSLITTGWGKTDWWKRQSDILQYAKFTGISKAECARHWRYVLDENLCALDKRKIYWGNLNVICKGDMGNPLVHVHNGVRYQTGIASWSSKYCFTLAPSVFNSLHYSKTFLEAQF